MISILIPIYNVPVLPLVETLRKQITTVTQEVEIVCLDDGSILDIKERNRKIYQFSEVIYEELPANVGRSAIRNHLAHRARYDLLLFLDCDAKIIREDFLKNYLTVADDATVYVGGRTYPDRPANPDQLLHWTYGVTREQSEKSAFQSNNFLIPKSIQLSYPFDESIATYGHEDTLLGYQLVQAGITIKHIDNPVEHNDLIPVADFLQKQRDAVLNLHDLLEKFPGIETRLTKTMERLKKWRLDGILQLVKGPMLAFATRRLSQGSSSLLLLDLYKVCYLLECNKSA